MFLLCSNTDVSDNVPLYVEDVFSTYVYTGNGSVQTINNGIDLATNGGLVWLKGRSAANTHALYDTVRGATYDLTTTSTAAQTTQNTGVTLFNSNGFTLGGLSSINANNFSYLSWAFRKQPKFFDIVSYTGTGVNKTVPHNLGSAPGFMIVKRTDTSGDWAVYHSGLSAANNLVLNTISPQVIGTTVWNSTAPNTTVFSVGTNAATNAAGAAYIAYLFANTAGGFGVSGSDSVISCGSFTLPASGNTTINLGWDPQFILTKKISSTGNWYVEDFIRGMEGSPATFSGTYPKAVYLNSSSAEAQTGGATGQSSLDGNGFTYWNTNDPGSSYIYVAIRRQTKQPTVGTDVFLPIARTGTGVAGESTSFGKVADLIITKQRNSTGTWSFTDRLRGNSKELTSASTSREVSYVNDVTNLDTMTGFKFGTGASGNINTSAATYIDYLFKRSPGFFDIVCYAGTRVNKTVSHSLGTTPEFIIAKNRTGSTAFNWIVYHKTLGSSDYMSFNANTTPISSTTQWTSTAPTSTVFSVGTGATNGTATTNVAYLFATLAGVSNVDTYTGNGSSQTIDCGFSTGARFILIKRTDAVGDWYSWDSTRGIVAATDPHLSFNTTAAEITTDDSIDPDSTGFIVNQVAGIDINVTSATYIYLAIS